MKRTALAVMVAGMCSGQATARMNFIEAFAESNYGQCVEFQFEGVAFYSKLSLSIFSGVAVTFFLSPITAHYNPDFLVTSYPRLGDSPLLESFITLGAAQNVVAAPVIELLTGTGVPESFDQVDQWSGQTSDKQNESHSTLQYYESEVFGHPGNVYTWASRAFRGELGQTGVPGLALLTAIPQDIAKTPDHVAQVISDLAQNAGTSLGNGFSADARARFDPVQVAADAVVGELRDLADESTLGRAVEAISGSNLSETNPIAFYNEVVTDNVVAISEASRREVEGSTESTFPDPDPDAAPPRIDFEGLTDGAVEELRERFGELTIENIVATARAEVVEATERVAEVADLFRVLNTGALADYQALVTPGVGFAPIGFKGFCPSDVDPFVPYYLSGTNILSWRFKLPELVYPQTYIPFSNQTTVGELLPGVNSNPFTALAQTQNYGSVYPRNGYLLQSDPLKAAAVVAFRSAHVVTRPGQPHIYRSTPARRYEDFTMYDNEYEELDFGSRSRDPDSVYLHPHQDEKGRWQLIHSEGAETEQSCHRFGSPDVNPEAVNADGSAVEGGNRLIGGLANPFKAQWTEGKVSDNNDYMFNLWRRYRCAPAPEGSFVFHIGNFVLPSPITLIE